MRVLLSIMSIYHCLSERLCVFVSVSLSEVPVYLSAFVCVSVCVRLCICLRVCLWVYLSICASACLCVCLTVCLSVCLLVCLSVWLCICLSERLCVSVCILHPCDIQSHDIMSHKAGLQNATGAQTKIALTISRQSEPERWADKNIFITRVDCPEVAIASFPILRPSAILLSFRLDHVGGQSYLRNVL